MEHYRRKQKMVTVRHISDDEVVAIIEIVSPGNKSHKRYFRKFVEKAADFIQAVHLLIIDVFPPGRYDPRGLHGAVWDEISGEDYRLPRRRPLTLASYESTLPVSAYVEHFAVGDKLVEMPLFLEPGGCVEAPLESTYQQAFDAVPKRWRDVLRPARS